MNGLILADLTRLGIGVRFEADGGSLDFGKAMPTVRQTITELLADKMLIGLDGAKTGVSSSTTHYHTHRAEIESLAKGILRAAINANVLTSPSPETTLWLL